MQDPQSNDQILLEKQLLGFIKYQLDQAITNINMGVENPLDFASNNLDLAFKAFYQLQLDVYSKNYRFFDDGLKPIRQTGNNLSPLQEMFNCLYLIKLSKNNTSAQKKAEKIFINKYAVLFGEKSSQAVDYTINNEKQISEISGKLSKIKMPEIKPAPSKKAETLEKDDLEVLGEFEENKKKRLRDLQRRTKRLTMQLQNKKNTGALNKLEQIADEIVTETETENQAADLDLNDEVNLDINLEEQLKKIEQMLNDNLETSSQVDSDTSAINLDSDVSDEESYQKLKAELEQLQKEVQEEEVDNYSILNDDYDMLLNDLYKTPVAVAAVEQKDFPVKTHNINGVIVADINLHLLKNNCEDPNSWYCNEYIDILLAEIKKSHQDIKVYEAMGTGQIQNKMAEIRAQKQSENYAFIPLNIAYGNSGNKNNANHWAALIIDYKNENIFYLDPAQSDEAPQEIENLKQSLKFKNEIIHNPIDFQISEKKELSESGIIHCGAYAVAMFSAFEKMIKQNKSVVNDNSVTTDHEVPVKSVLSEISPASGIKQLDEVTIKRIRENHAKAVRPLLPKEEVKESISKKTNPNPNLRQTFSPGTISNKPKNENPNPRNTVSDIPHSVKSSSRKNQDVKTEKSSASDSALPPTDMPPQFTRPKPVEAALVLDFIALNQNIINELEEGSLAEINKKEDLKPEIIERKGYIEKATEYLKQYYPKLVDENGKLVLQNEPEQNPRASKDQEAKFSMMTKSLAVPALGFIYSQVFEFAATGNPEALEYAWTGFYKMQLDGQHKGKSYKFFEENYYLSAPLEQKGENLSFEQQLFNFVFQLTQQNVRNSQTMGNGAYNNALVESLKGFLDNYNACILIPDEDDIKNMKYNLLVLKSSFKGVKEEDQYDQDQVFLKENGFADSEEILFQSVQESLKLSVESNDETARIFHFEYAIQSFEKLQKVHNDPAQYQVHYYDSDEFAAIDLSKIDSNAMILVGYKPRPNELAVQGTAYFVKNHQFVMAGEQQLKVENVNLPDHEKCKLEKSSQPPQYDKAKRYSGRFQETDDNNVILNKLKADVLQKAGLTYQFFDEKNQLQKQMGKQGKLLPVEYLVNCTMDLNSELKANKPYSPESVGNLNYMLKRLSREVTIPLEFICEELKVVVSPRAKMAEKIEALEDVLDVFHEADKDHKFVDKKTGKSRIQIAGKNRPLSSEQELFNCVLNLYSDIKNSYVTHKETYEECINGKPQFDDKNLQNLNDLLLKISNKEKLVKAKPKNANLESICGYLNLIAVQFSCGGIDTGDRTAYIGGVLDLFFQQYRGFFNEQGQGQQQVPESDKCLSFEQELFNCAMSLEIENNQEGQFNAETLSKLKSLLALEPVCAQLRIVTSKDADQEEKEAALKVAIDIFFEDPTYNTQFFTQFTETEPARAIKQVPADGQSLSLAQQLFNCASDLEEDSNTGNNQFKDEHLKQMQTWLSKMPEKTANQGTQVPEELKDYHTLLLYICGQLHNLFSPHTDSEKNDALKHIWKAFYLLQQKGQSDGRRYVFFDVEHSNASHKQEGENLTLAQELFNCVHQMLSTGQVDESVMINLGGLLAKAELMGYSKKMYERLDGALQNDINACPLPRLPEDAVSKNPEIKFHLQKQSAFHAVFLSMAACIVAGEFDLTDNLSLATNAEIERVQHEWVRLFNGNQIDGRANWTYEDIKAYFTGMDTYQTQRELQETFVPLLEAEARQMRQEKLAEYKRNSQEDVLSAFQLYVNSLGENNKGDNNFISCPAVTDYFQLLCRGLNVNNKEDFAKVSQAFLNKTHNQIKQKWNNEGLAEQFVDYAEKNHISAGYNELTPVCVKYGFDIKDRGEQQINLHDFGTVRRSDFTGNLDNEVLIKELIKNKIIAELPAEGSEKSFKFLVSGQQMEAILQKKTGTCLLDILSKNSAKHINALTDEQRRFLYESEVLKKSGNGFIVDPDLCVTVEGQEIIRGYLAQMFFVEDIRNFYFNNCVIKVPLTLRQDISSGWTCSPQNSEWTKSAPGGDTYKLKGLAGDCKPSVYDVGLKVCFDESAEYTSYWRLMEPDNAQKNLIKASDAASALQEKIKSGDPRFVQMVEGALIDLFKKWASQKVVLRHGEVNEHLISAYFAYITYSIDGKTFAFTDFNKNEILGWYLTHVAEGIIPLTNHLIAVYATAVDQNYVIWKKQPGLNTIQPSNSSLSANNIAIAVQILQTQDEYGNIIFKKLDAEEMDALPYAPVFEVSRATCSDVNVQPFPQDQKYYSWHKLRVELELLLHYQTQDRNGYIGIPWLDKYSLEITTQADHIKGLFHTVIRSLESIAQMPELAKYLLGEYEGNQLNMSDAEYFDLYVQKVRLLWEAFKQVKDLGFVGQEQNNNIVDAQNFIAKSVHRNFYDPFAQRSAEDMHWYTLDTENNSVTLPANFDRSYLYFTIEDKFDGSVPVYKVWTDKGAVTMRIAPDTFPRHLRKAVTAVPLALIEWGAWALGYFIWESIAAAMGKNEDAQETAGKIGGSIGIGVVFFLGCFLYYKMVKPHIWVKEHIKDMEGQIPYKTLRKVKVISEPIEEFQEEVPVDDMLLDPVDDITLSDVEPEVFNKTGLEGGELGAAKGKFGKDKIYSGGKKEQQEPLPSDDQNLFVNRKLKDLDPRDPFMSDYIQPSYGLDMKLESVDKKPSRPGVIKMPSPAEMQNVLKKEEVVYEKEQKLEKYKANLQGLQQNAVPLVDEGKDSKLSRVSFKEALKPVPQKSVPGETTTLSLVKRWRVPNGQEKQENAGTGKVEKLGHSLTTKTDKDELSKINLKPVSQKIVPESESISTDLGRKPKKNAKDSLKHKQPQKIIKSGQSGYILSPEQKLSELKSIETVLQKISISTDASLEGARKSAEKMLPVLAHLIQNPELISAEDIEAMAQLLRLDESHSLAGGEGLLQINVDSTGKGRSGIGDNIIREAKSLADALAAMGKYLYGHLLPETVDFAAKGFVNQDGTNADSRTLQAMEQRFEELKGKLKNLSPEVKEKLAPKFNNISKFLETGIRWITDGWATNKFSVSDFYTLISELEKDTEIRQAIFDGLKTGIGQRMIGTHQDFLAKKQGMGGDVTTTKEPEKKLKPESYQEDEFGVVVHFRDDEIELDSYKKDRTPINSGKKEERTGVRQFSEKKSNAKNAGQFGIHKTVTTGYVAYTQNKEDADLRGIKKSEKQPLLRDSQNARSASPLNQQYNTQKK